MWWKNKKDLKNAIKEWEELIEDYNKRLSSGKKDGKEINRKDISHKLHNALIVLQTLKSKLK